MHALIADELDIIEEDNPEGFDIGVVAFAIEVITPDPENTWVRREEGRYFPPADTDGYWSYYCSDYRRWVKTAVFRDAYNFYEYPSTHGGTEEDEQDEPDE
jgi:hypothetical protein